MKWRPCDELGLNLYEAGLQWACSPDLALATRLIEYVCARYTASNFEGLLERALDSEIVVDETLRHAYKMALGHFFYARIKEKREALSIPFAPR